MRETTANRLCITPQPQRQDSLADQLRDLHHLAARVGMYDAADWLWKKIVGFEAADSPADSEPARASDQG